MIQQFRMRGQCALVAEVIGGRHDAFAKHQLPQAIDRNPCRERVSGIEEPFRKPNAIAGIFFGEGQYGRGCARLHLVSMLVVHAALQYVGGTRLGEIAHHHDFLHRVEAVAEFLANRPQGGINDRYGFEQRNGFQCLQM